MKRLYSLAMPLTLSTLLLYTVVVALLRCGVLWCCICCLAAFRTPSGSRAHVNRFDAVYSRAALHHYRAYFY